MKIDRAPLILLASIGGFAVSFIPLPWLPRFTVDALNYLYIVSVILAILYAFAAVGINLRRRFRRFVILTLAAMIVVVAAPISVIALVAYRPGDLISEISSDGGFYRLYRFECELLCPTRLELRRELEFMSLVKIVRPIWSGDHEMAELRASRTGEIEVVVGHRLLYRVRD